MNSQTLGSRLRTMREANELSLAQVAERSGLTKAYIGNVEHDRVNPSVKTVEALAKGLGCSPGWLAFGGER